MAGAPLGTEPAAHVATISSALLDVADGVGPLFGVWRESRLRRLQRADRIPLFVVRFLQIVVRALRPP